MPIAPLKYWLSKAFNLPVLQGRRQPWVDYLRGITILLVVYRHVLIGLQRSHFEVPAIFEKANLMFYSFRMPLFFILSGILINNSIRKRSLKLMIIKKSEVLLYPYFLWSVIQITLQILFSAYANDGRTYADYLFIFYQPRLIDQFWYLPALFNTTIIYLFLKLQLHVPGWLQLLIGLGLHLLAGYIHDFSMMSDWMSFYFFFALGEVASTLFFRERVQQYLKTPATLLLIIPVFITVQIYYLSSKAIGEIEFIIIALVGCLSMFVLSFRLQSWNILQFLRILGYHSLYIYVMHVIVSAFVRSVLIKFFGLHNPVSLLCFGIVAGVAVPIVIYNLFIRDNIGWFLFSPHRPPGRVAGSIPI